MAKEGEKPNNVLYVDSLLDDYGLDAIETRVLQGVRRRDGRGQGCTESVRNMAARYEISQGSVERALWVLVLAGILDKRKRTRKGSAISSVFFVVHDKDRWVLSPREMSKAAAEDLRPCRLRWLKFVRGKSWRQLRKAHGDQRFNGFDHATALWATDPLPLWNLLAECEADGSLPRSGPVEVDLPSRSAAMKEVPGGVC